MVKGSLVSFVDKVTARRIGVVILLCEVETARAPEAMLASKYRRFDRPGEPCIILRLLSIFSCALLMILSVLPAVGGPGGRAGFADRRNCDIEVDVVDSTGAAARSAQVILTPKWDKSLAPSEGATDTSGTFRKRISTGNYALEVALAGFRRYQSEAKISCEGRQNVKIRIRLELGI